MPQYSSIETLYQAFLSAGSQVCTDTRKIVTGSIFFALKGDTFNGNLFGAKAVEQGCAYVVIDDENEVKGEEYLLVENVLDSLQQLANYHRRQFSIPFLAITGSNAKTTNKELIKVVLSKKYNTLATEGNLNNHIGVPLTLLKVSEQHEFAIIEMGANHQGEIAALCKIAEPDFGMITNIGKAHLEGFGGIEGVKKGKSEIYKYLKPKDGEVFINGDDNILHELAIDNDKVTFGCKKLYDVIGRDFSVEETVSLKFTTRYGEKDWNKLPLINTQMHGKYNFVNCLAAACVGHYFKVDDELIKQALEEYVPNMNRSQIVKTARNTIMLDAYNANPNSMTAAIEDFFTINSSNKWLLLGDMFELGEFSTQEHEQIINLVKEKRFENVAFVGKEFLKEKSDDFLFFENTESCKQYFSENSISESTILIKGSRGMKMETLLDIL
jgi:UDP-N-acetylmuramoyl-tripeptide--D-alanyl-D-alanine ligase